MQNVIKRNGQEVVFNKEKIVNAIKKANTEVDGIHQLNDYQIEAIADRIAKMMETATHAMSVEDIQDQVETGLMEMRGYEVAQKYIRYRYKRSLARKANTTDASILALIDQQNEEVKQENSNKNPTLNSTQRDYMAGEVSKDVSRRILLPEDVVKAHDEGLIHYHDMDYNIQRMYNCSLLNLEDMLQNGTVISGTKIDKPHSFHTACNIATQALASVSSNQFGGQSLSLAHLSPFVDVSRKKIREEVEQEFADIDGVTKEQKDAIAENRLRKEIRDGVQTLQYQILTLMTCNGQAPFVTVFMYLDEVEDGQQREDLATVIKEVLKQRIQGVKNDAGAWITPAFPKLIYVLDEDNTYPGSRYYALTELAAKCTAKRMVPDYISAKVMKEVKNGDVFPAMGCRSMLTPDDGSIGNISGALNYVPGQHKYYGRFNQGVVTINLVDVACSAVKEATEKGTDKFSEFWRIFDERLELCHKGLQFRHNRLLGTPSDVAPILWQHGAIARLKKGEKIDKLLFNNYSTISLGYAGLYEMCVEMTGKSHTDPEAKPFALSVMQHLNDKCDEWKKAENVAYSLYGTPLESTTYKFAKCLQKRFGMIPNVTDHNYITNSYHVNVREKIDAFTKLKFESEFQKLSPGGYQNIAQIATLNHVNRHYSAGVAISG